MRKFQKITLADLDLNLLSDDLEYFLCYERTPYEPDRNKVAFNDIENYNNAFKLSSYLYIKCLDKIFVKRSLHFIWHHLIGTRAG